MPEHTHRERPALIVSDDSRFASSIIERWQQESRVPIRVMSSADCQRDSFGEFQFAVLGGLHPNACERVLAFLTVQDFPVILVGGEGGLREVAERQMPRVLVLPTRQGWRDLLIVMVSEVMRCWEAEARARRAEEANAQLQCEARLGQYVIEVRHNLNNALTSVLGNAELLQLDGAARNKTELAQLDTIRIMALRMHETLQRFSSLEKELRATNGRSNQDERRSSEQDGQLTGWQDENRHAQELGSVPLARAAGAD
jgi:signal transduction histidine kinase